MSIELTHTIVHVKDRWPASRDVGQVLGLPEATAYGPFAELKLDNGASLDFMDTEGEIRGQHYAFLVSEEDFDVILGRLQDEGREWWADPYKREAHEINHGDGGRGLYWDGPHGTGWRSSPSLRQRRLIAGWLLTRVGSRGLGELVEAAVESGYHHHRVRAGRRGGGRPPVMGHPTRLGH